MKTNYGELDVVVDSTTNRAKRVRGGVVGTRQISSGINRLSDVCASRTIAPKGPAGSNPAPSPFRSKLEAAYANYLECQRRAGMIASWQYEPVNFRLPGKKNFYKPDFLVVAGDGLTFFDTKGRNKSDDRSLVKIKTAAGLNRWARFVQVKLVKGVWEERLIDVA